MFSLIHVDSKWLLACSLYSLYPKPNSLDPSLIANKLAFNETQNWYAELGDCAHRVVRCACFFVRVNGYKQNPLKSYCISTQEAPILIQFYLCHLICACLGKESYHRNSWKRMPILVAGISRSHNLVMRPRKCVCVVVCVCFVFIIIRANQQETGSTFNDYTTTTSKMTINMIKPN